MTAEAPLPAYLIHWDAPEWCRDAARSLLASTGVAVEVVVVDNGQTHGPPVASVLPPEVRVLAMASNGGYTGGANAALDDWRDRFPQSELAVIGSHDLMVRPDTLARLVAAAGERPDCGLLAPALLSPVATSGGVVARAGPIQAVLAGAPERVERVRSLLAAELAELLAGQALSAPAAGGELARLETPTLRLSASPGDGELVKALEELRCGA